jgi:hypothetical protein
MTVRELIRLQVREEVARHNARPSDRFNGLVRPDVAETELNGYARPPYSMIQSSRPSPCCRTRATKHRLR